ncbi:MAG: hypothetical protein HQK54_03320 [Oligoflexales bacterium]|nr:hypothetical protein [Oligoflexales bacterium]
MRKILIPGLVLIIAVFSFLGAACVSLRGGDSGEKELPPQITEDISTEKAVENGIKFGGDTLVEAKKLIDKRNEWPKVKQQVEKIILTEIKTMSSRSMINAVHLYQIGSLEVDMGMLKAFLASNRAEIRQIGWQMAASYPSNSVARYLDEVLTKAVLDGDEDRVLIPEMAQAVQVNMIRSEYSLLKQGLMKQRGSEFAKAMMILEPEKASEDFMDYLALATIEDLRQLNQSTVDLHTTLVIFRHFMSHPVSLTNPKYSHLFLYAISRNQTLAEMAHIVIEKQIPQYRNQMALILSTLPVWIQVAYVEGVKDKMNSNVNLFLAQLRDKTSFKEVVEEINSIEQR